MMKCRLFSALLLLFTLMATGCSGQPAAVTAGDLADQVYIYEKRGLGAISISPSTVTEVCAVPKEP